MNETTEYARGYDHGITGGDARLDTDSPEFVRGVFFGRKFRDVMLSQGFRETAPGEFEVTLTATREGGGR